METGLKFDAGDFVEVLRKEEILATLDNNGQLDGLPFMPQMFKYCGRRLRVFKRAHKSCDTVNQTGGLRMASAVHLEGIRCDGEAYGGCQAMCLIYWKTAWLKPVSETASSKEPGRKRELSGGSTCAEGDVWAGTRTKDSQTADDPTYVCQATQMPQATAPLRWWEISQYVEDYTSGNATMGRLLRGLLYSCTYNVIQSGIGLGPFLRWIYDKLQAIWGGIPYPRKRGTIPSGGQTPTCALNLQPGELVRVKSHEEILRTLNVENKNRGLYFDAESVPFCGGTYRVLKRVCKIVDEKTGKLIKLKNESIMLEDVYCQARYSRCRMFCPRSIYSYWREIWLERVAEKDVVSQPHEEVEVGASCDARRA